MYTYETKSKVFSLRKQNGSALVIGLFVTVFLIGFGTMFIMSVQHENQMTIRMREESKAFYAAQGGANAGFDALDNLINNYLRNTVSNANPNSLAGYTQGRVSSGDGLGWLLYAVRDNNNPVLIQNGEEAQYSQTATLGENSYQYLITITEKEDPETVNPDVWDFSYNFVIDSDGQAAGNTKNVIIDGDFTVRVQKDNFAKYALFTNIQELPNGDYVWFTDNTNFAGPVHTNEMFNFAFDPSGTFDGLVTQDEEEARFLNGGSPITMDADFNGSDDVPKFNAGFFRDAGDISLSSPSQQQDMENEATAGNSYSNNGIYIPNDGAGLTGGIFVKGNARVSLQVDANNHAVYKINQQTREKIITVDHDNQTTSILNTGTGLTENYSGIPDGTIDSGTLIYVNGKIKKIKGTVQEDTEITVASTNDIIISNDIQYSDFTPGSGTPGQPGYISPNAQGATNLLGLVSWSGDVRIRDSAPDDVSIHASILAKDGIFQVDDFDDTGVGPRGTATLLGGVISDNYGGFGLFDVSDGQQLSGYGRNFVYDERMQFGKAPPYFPTLSTFIAFTNNITDNLSWQQGE